MPRTTFLPGDHRDWLRGVMNMPCLVIPASIPDYERSLAGTAVGFVRRASGHLRYESARSREYRQSRPREPISTRESRALLMSYQPFRTNLASFRKKLRPGEGLGPLIKFSMFDPPVRGFVCRVFDFDSGGRWLRLARFTSPRKLVDPYDTPYRLLLGGFVWRLSLVGHVPAHSRQINLQHLDTQLGLSPHTAGICVSVGQAFQPDSLGSQAGKPDLP